MSTTLPSGAGLALDSEPLAHGRQRVRLAYWSPLFAVLTSDLLTKSIAADTLALWHPPRPVIGDILRFSLAYNPGIAFGWHVGPASRPVFSILALLVLLVLFRLYRTTAAGDTTRALALGLICGGAIGNLADRLRSPQGVVDFIDIGIGDARWWTFNIADIGVGIGALLLIGILWRPESPESPSTPEPAP